MDWLLTLGILFIIIAIIFVILGFIGRDYGLALNAWNTVHHNCCYICNSWIYRQGSMDNWKVDYYPLYYSRDNFPDPRKTPVLTFF